MAGSISLGKSNFSIVEGAAPGSVSVQILRSGSLEGNVTVGYATIGNTAESGGDFQGMAGTVVFAPGETSKIITIPILDDGLAEGTERFSFVIDSVVGGTLTVPRTADISILDDEAPTTGGDDDAAPPYPLDVEIVTYVDGMVTPMTMQWLPNDPSIMLVADKRGRILSVRDGELQPGAILDIQDQVNSSGDRGLMDIELDPNFPDNPYLYAIYVYDPPETADAPAGSLARPDGLANRPARVSRFEVTFDAEGNPRIDRGSEQVLIGAAGSWETISGSDVDSTVDFDQPPSGIDPVTGENIQDYIAVDSGTHAPGDIEFGLDGALYISTGDGTSFNAVDLRSLRVQDVGNLSGKVLRVDPETGRGLADNPFYNGDPDSNASKVYQLGLRNGFRMDFDPTNGKLYIGDVGWTLWEQLETGGPGANFGWPYYEGGDGVMTPQPLYSSLAEAQAFYAAVDRGDITLSAPVRAFSHDPSTPGPDMRAIIVGAVYDGTVYPELLQGDIFFGDIGGQIYTMDVNDPTRTVRLLAESDGGFVDYIQGPDGYIYVADLFAGAIKRLEIRPRDSLVGTAGPDVLRGTGGADVLLGFAGDDILYGGAGDDRLEGGPGNDRLEGGGGDDTLFSGAGDDILYGGAGADTLYGGSGIDVLYGGSEDDVYVIDNPAARVVEYAGAGIDLVNSSISYVLAANLENLTLIGDAAIAGTGNELNNVITGNSAANLLTGGAGNDTLLGGGATDRLEGGAGDDRLEGGAAADILYGGAGVDTLYGGAGDDALHGGTGADMLFGGTGADRLHGGTGADLLTGGAGADVFVFGSVEEVGLGGGRDVIADFAPGADLIDLTEIDADLTAAGNQAFAFIGGRGFGEDAGELRFAGGILAGDVDGDGEAEFEIALAGVAALTAASFLL